MITAVKVEMAVKHLIEDESAVFCFKASNKNI